VEAKHCISAETNDEPPSQADQDQGGKKSTLKRERAMRKE